MLVVNEYLCKTTSMKQRYKRDKTMSHCLHVQCSDALLLSRRVPTCTFKGCLFSRRLLSCVHCISPSVQGVMSSAFHNIIFAGLHVHTIAGRGELYFVGCSQIRIGLWATKRGERLFESNMVHDTHRLSRSCCQPPSVSPPPKPVHLHTCNSKANQHLWCVD